MNSWLVRYRVYGILAVLAIYLSATHSLEAPSARDWLQPLVLLLLAAGLAGTRLRLQSTNGALALPDVFVFGAVVSLSPPVGALAAAAVAAFGTERKGPQRKAELSLRVGVAAASALGARFLYFQLQNAFEQELIALVSSAVFFLVSNSLTESLRGRLPYWRKLLASRAFSAIQIGLLFTPAAVLLVLAFDPDPGFVAGLFLWRIAPAAVLLYLICEWRLGPLYEDLSKKDQTDEVYLRAVEALALAVEAKDTISGTHLKRVQYYCLEIAKALNCTETEIRALEFGALLHDIGKIAIPEELLTKPSRLSPHEFSQVASHARIGAEIVAAANFPFPVAEVVLSHHENWDGTGYPRKLKGEEIPLTARILTVVDNFDALTSDRPYRAALTVEQATDFIKARRGKAFEPRVADTLLELLPRLERELRKDPAFRRGMTASTKSMKREGSIHVEQTSLTYQERMESLKQNRTPARESTHEVEASALQRLVSSLGTSLSRKELLHFVSLLLAEKLPFDECAVFMVEGSGLTPVYSTGQKADLLRNLQVPVNESPTGWVAGFGHTLMNGNPIGEYSELGMMASMQGLRAALVTPLWATGRVVGTFNLYSKTAAVYSDEHAVMLEDFTRKLGRILLESALYEAAERRLVDPLTDLPNARQTLRYLAAAVEDARQRDRALSVLCIDIDHFRALNSRRGYPAGDQVLQLLAQILTASKRNFEFLGRLGDDRFVAVVPETQRPRLESLVLQLKQVVRTRCDQLRLGLEDPVTISVGSAIFPSEARSAEELLVASHQRAYLEKLNRAGITIQVTEGRLGSATTAAAV